MFIIEDEEYKKVKFEKIFVLCFVFMKGGMVIVVNVFMINDGVLVLIFVSVEKVKELGLIFIVKIKFFVDVVYEL